MCVCMWGGGGGGGGGGGVNRPTGRDINSSFPEGVDRPTGRAVTRSCTSAPECVALGPQEGTAIHTCKSLVNHENSSPKKEKRNNHAHARTHARAHTHTHTP